MLSDFMLPDYVKSIRLSKLKNPCLNCYLHRDLCLCSEISPISLKTKLTLIIHYKELKRPTNTGVLAVQTLRNSKMIIHGEPGIENNFNSLISSQYRNVVLFPSSDARELNADFLSESSLPIHLIVPDGNWRQASKIPTKHLNLPNLEKIKISSKNNYKFFLRKETSIYGMATLQAIAQAYKIIEDDWVYQKLIKLYDLKLQKTLTARGCHQIVT